jgi:hypothetical protein
MLGDCYAAAIVEHLSKDQLMAIDAVSYQVRIEINLFTITYFLHTKQDFY